MKPDGPPRPSGPGTRPRMAHSRLSMKVMIMTGARLCSTISSSQSDRSPIPSCISIDDVRAGA